MIWEWKSCSIVMLTELEERGQVSSERSWAVGDRDHMKKVWRGISKTVCLDLFFDLNCPKGHFLAVVPSQLVPSQLVSVVSQDWKSSAVGASIRFQIVHTHLPLS